MSHSRELVVVGSVAVDWVITPHAQRPDSVGGSAVYFSMAAAHDAQVKLVGVVGKDFPEVAIRDLRDAGVDLSGLEVVDGNTFRWKGRYHDNMNSRDTLETHLNVFEHFRPVLPQSYRNAEFLFLANIQPTLQGTVLDQMQRRPRLVGLDTMNLWIDIAGDDLRAVLRRIDVLIINEEESMQLAGTDGIVPAARIIRELGPSVVVIKRGEYGAMLFGPGDHVFALPALPIERVVDPTGAGDCFAGGFMGHLAACGETDSASLRRAAVWGSVLASFCVEGFSYDALRGRMRAELEARYRSFVELTQFG